MEVIEIGNLREAHKHSIDKHLVCGLIRVEVDDERLPKRGIIISATKRELEKIDKNLLFMKVKVTGVEKPKRKNAPTAKTKGKARETK